MNGKMTILGCSCEIESVSFQLPKQQEIFRKRPAQETIKTGEYLFGRIEVYESYESTIQFAQHMINQWWWFRR